MSLGRRCPSGRMRGGTIPENATIAKAEDLFPDDDNNKGLLYPREILETETLNDRENEEFGDY